jgi:hypothetical protein
MWVVCEMARASALSKTALMLEDSIRENPTKLYTSNAQAEMSSQAKVLLCNFGVKDGSAELHYQNQNPAMCEIQDMKKDMEVIMNKPTHWWCIGHCVLNISHCYKNHQAKVVLYVQMP